MPLAARLTDCTGHAATPLAPGTASPSVMIAGMPAWRALPAGVGDGIEKSSRIIEKFTQQPMIRPPAVIQDLVDMQAGLAESAAAAAQAGNPAAAAATAGAFTALNVANVALAAAYTTAAAVPGGEPAAATAYALGLQQALAAAAAASIAAIAAMTDTHICPLCTPVPHGPGVVTKGSKTVFINGLPAVRQGDQVFEAAGGANPISIGCPTVNIG